LSIKKFKKNYEIIIQIITLLGKKTKGEKEFALVKEVIL